MKKFYLTGQRTFGNRGCEAIVRSTVALLKEQFGEITVFVPSDNIELDKKQWPAHAESGVVFVPLYYPKLTRYWVQLQRLPFAFLKRMNWPFSADSTLKRTLESVDAVLSIGGDMYTYEGRLPSWIMGIDHLAMKMGKPVVLWGATVSNFQQEPFFIPSLKQHFEKMALTVVRESLSEKILLEDFGLNNVIRMPDSAFTLSKQVISTDEFWPSEPDNGVLGVNVSPLIEKFSGQRDRISTEVIKFITKVVNEKSMSVLLVPHVTPLDGALKNNDYEYMLKILGELNCLGDKVKIMDPSLNASQIKYVISKCRYFIGARTHSTIAALSSLVPTVSIAYSQKARGINLDLFGDEPVVIPLSELNSEKMYSSFEYLEKNELRLKAMLSDKVLHAKKMILESVVKLSEKLD
ncbi:MAG: polysaccharide pyruvyl transferase family protein [Methyloprofundus sp.]|nr:polysaccharide pyruvyl transferase family protein [Methyloprofundus sp.]